METIEDHERLAELTAAVGVSDRSAPQSCPGFAT